MNHKQYTNRWFTRDLPRTPSDCPFLPKITVGNPLRDRPGYSNGNLFIVKRGRKVRRRTKESIRHKKESFPRQGDYHSPPGCHPSRSRPVSTGPVCVCVETASYRDGTSCSHRRGPQGRALLHSLVQGTCSSTSTQPQPIAILLTVESCVSLGGRNSQSHLKDQRMRAPLGRGRGGGSFTHELVRV